MGGTSKSWSDWTEPYFFNINTELPTPPENSFLITSKPTFRWVPKNPNSNLFKIQVSESPTFDSPIIDDFCYIPQYEPAEDISDGGYFWRVREKDTTSTNGWSEWTIPIRFVLNAKEDEYPNTWRPLAQIPHPVNEGGALTFAIEDPAQRKWVSAFVGGDNDLFYRYRIYENPPYWEEMSPCPHGPEEEEVDWGGSLVFVKSRGENAFYLYALKGNTSKEFWRGGPLPYSDNSTAGGGQSSRITSANTPLLRITPNPFSKRTLIHILPQKKTLLKVYNLAGKLIKTFSSNSSPIYWNGRDNEGKEIPDKEIKRRGRRKIPPL